MIKEAWDSFKDNIRERVSNPFLGTFALVWIVHNWKIVYAFFYFDIEWKLQQKIDYFKSYWSENNFIWNLICVALITICVLIITYLFLALSRFFSNYFENVIIPFVYKFSKGKIVTAETYQSALDKINLLEEKFEMERKAKNNLLLEIEEITKRIGDKSQNSEDGEDNVSNIEKLINVANSTYTKKDIEGTLLGISKKLGFKRDHPLIDFLLKNNLIELVEKKPSAASAVGTTAYSYYYKFTDLGNKFKKLLFEK